MISIKDISIKLGNKQLFSDFSLEIETGKTTALIAPSGSGKTTLLNIIAGIIPQDSGTLDFQNNEMPEKISYLFQEPRLLPWCSIEKNLTLVLENSFSQEDAQARTYLYLEKVNLLNRASDLPEKLSGGEMQRVALARAFAYPSNFLLMDEAFQGQDLPLRIKLMELLESLLAQTSDMPNRRQISVEQTSDMPNRRQMPKTVLMVTHDIREAGCLADKILLLSGEPLQIISTLDLPKDERPMIERYLNPQEAILQLERKFSSLY